MRSQEVLFAAGAALLLGLCAALLMVSGGTVSEAKAVEANEPVAKEATPAPEPPAARGATEVPITVGDVRETIDTRGWTSGQILGDIWLAASAAPKLQSITVTVQELRGKVEGESRPPFHRVVPVPVGVGTPTFSVRDIPFSEYGYIVRANSPGLNGGQQVVQIDKAHPCQEVKLMISPGVACSVLLRDQDQGFVTETDVTLFPTGDPPGRQIHKGKSDNFGCAVLLDVLAGDYVVYAGPVSAPLAEAELTVQPGTGIRSQGLTVAVPRGKQVVIAVNDILDHGIADAQVKVLATDKARLNQLETTTDYSGKATFPFLAPGRYQIDVFKPDFERRSGTLTVNEAEAVPEQAFRLVRLR